VQPGRHVLSFSLRGDASEATSVPDGTSGDKRTLAADSGAYDLILVDRPFNGVGTSSSRALLVDLSDPAAPRAGPGISRPFLRSAAIFQDVVVLVATSGFDVSAFWLGAPQGEPVPIEIDPSLDGSAIDVRQLAGEAWLLMLDGLVRLERRPHPDGSGPPRVEVAAHVDVSDLDGFSERAVEVAYDGVEAWILDQNAGLWRMALDPLTEPRLAQRGDYGPLAVAADTIAFAQGDRVRLLNVPPDPNAAGPWMRSQLLGSPPTVVTRSALSGGCALVDESYGAGGPSWIDLSRPSHPAVFGHTQVTHLRAIASAEGVFHMVSAMSASPELLSVACGELLIANRLELPGRPSTIALSGRHAIVGIGYRLGLLDLGASLRPRLLLSWPVRVFDAPVDAVAMTGERWAALLPGQIVAGHFEAGAAPPIDTTLNAPAGSTTLLWIGRRLVLASPGSVTVIDFADPARPQVLGEIDVPGVPRALALGAPGHIWVIVDDAGGQSSLRLLDLRAGSPRERAWTTVPGTGRHVAAAGRTALVSAGEAGLLVVRDPAPPEGPTIHLPYLAGAMGP
jgi:hypothetical protein